ncbi:MAG: DUF4097 family beta strand repeat protein [Clostridia bacterium]|nr:DUF4097 family beta strand repeat protein [Clostridia bacterium]
MKKAALIIATILLVAGLIIGFVALASAKFNFHAFETASSELKDYPVEAEFRGIEIHGNTEIIRFERSSDGTAHVQCRETKRNTHTVEAENGTLKIVSEETSGWRNPIEISFEKEQITVFLPKDAYETLSIETHTGDVGVPDWLTFDGAAIHTSTGDVRFDAAVKNLLSIETSTGDVFMSGASAKAIDCKTTTGDIRMTNIACEGDVRVKVSTGEAFLEGLTAASFISEGSTGDIVLENVLIGGTLSIERSTGDVALRNSDAAEVWVKTSTGDVTGTLRTEKIFVTKTSTGDVHVPDSASGGKCSITTATGDILIRIVPNA